MQKQNDHISSFHRMSALDGLRGFAIILVFLNHIPTFFIQRVIPQSIFGWFLINGVTGVTLLFILSGFLMYYIYPEPSGWPFLQKRYTRIFPLFLTMAAVMVTTRQLPNAAWITLLAVLLLFPLVAHVIWKIFKKLPKVLGKLLFFGFFSLQFLSGFFYLFWINRHTFAVFSALPKVVHEGIIYLVNATLTLPLGQYVPMLDGVYWSLASEILFYILYPVLVVPLIQFLLPKSRKVKIIFLVCLFFLLGGIHMLSYKLFVLSLVQPALFFYFAAGIVLAYLYKNKPNIFSNLSKIFSGKWYIVPFIFAFLVGMTINDLSFLGQWISPWVRMLFAFPIAFCVALLLSQKTILEKIFTSKLLIFLGMISYSLYLSHGLIIHIAEMVYLPNSLFTNIAYVAIVFIIECIVAYYLYTLLEKPYFVKDRHTLPKESIQQKGYIQGKGLLFIISTVYLFAVVGSYQSKEGFNFFSYAIPIAKNNFVLSSTHDTSLVTISTNHPLILTFSTSANNFGVLSLQLDHKLIKDTRNPQSLEFALIEKGSGAVVNKATYNLDEFNSDKPFPFGFPVITNARGKTYTARFSLINSASSDVVLANLNSANAVYSADKKSLLTHPEDLFQFMSGKIQAIIYTPEALFALLLLVPFLFFAIFS